MGFHLYRSDLNYNSNKIFWYGRSYLKLVECCFICPWYALDPARSGEWRGSWEGGSVGEKLGLQLAINLRLGHLCFSEVKLSL